MLDDIFLKLMALSNTMKHKKIIIFGCGKGGKLTAIALKTLGLEPSYFVDNDKALIGNELYGIPIMSPNELVTEKADSIIILIGSMFFEEIIEQVIQLGFKEETHCYTVLPKIPKVAKANQFSRNERVINGVRIGKYSYGYERLCYKDSRLESVGAFCSINNTVQIGTNHPTEYITTHPFFYLGHSQLIGEEMVPPLLQNHELVNGWEISNNRKIIIGNDVWIGANVVLLPSIKIGNGAIIGAGAVVTRDVPDYAVVVGVPARVIKYRFSQEQIDLLNRVKWWAWSDEKIKENAQYFSRNLEFFEHFA